MTLSQSEPAGGAGESGRFSIASRITQGIQLSPLVGLSPFFAFHFGCRGLRFALRRTNISRPHDQVLSGSKTAILPDARAEQPERKENS
jgi:hypothetical protein